MLYFAEPDRDSPSSTLEAESAAQVKSIPGRGNTLLKPWGRNELTWKTGQ